MKKKKATKKKYNNYVAFSLDTFSLCINVECIFFRLFSCENVYRFFVLFSFLRLIYQTFLRDFASNDLILHFAFGIHLQWLLYTVLYTKKNTKNNSLMLMLRFAHELRLHSCVHRFFFHFKLLLLLFFYILFPNCFLFAAAVLKSKHKEKGKNFITHIDMYIVYF